MKPFNFNLLVVMMSTLCAFATISHAQSKPINTTHSTQNVQQLVNQIHIPYEQFTLANGLTVVVHTDKRAPIVSVAVWYNVGSRDEPQGKKGYAHLFEHLMFGGSQNVAQNSYDTLVQLGASEMNGTTSYDYTRYFQTVPKSSLEQTLFIESDRMGYFIPSLTSQRLAKEKQIVLNEKQQRESQRYGTLYDQMRQAILPSNHAYYASILGDDRDIQNATLDDIKQWFTQYYAPNNAVLVLAGDIDVKQAKKLANQYFAQIQSGQKHAVKSFDVPVLNQNKSLVL